MAGIWPVSGSGLRGVQDSLLGENARLANRNAEWQRRWPGRMEEIRRGTALLTGQAASGPGRDAVIRRTPYYEFMPPGAGQDAARGRAEFEASPAAAGRRAGLKANPKARGPVLTGEYGALGVEEARGPRTPGLFKGADGKYYGEESLKLPSAERTPLSEAEVDERRAVLADEAAKRHKQVVNRGNRKKRKAKKEG